MCTPLPYITAPQLLHSVTILSSCLREVVSCSIAEMFIFCPPRLHWISVGVIATTMLQISCSCGGVNIAFFCHQHKGSYVMECCNVNTSSTELFSAVGQFTLGCALQPLSTSVITWSAIVAHISSGTVIYSMSLYSSVSFSVVFLSLHSHGSLLLRLG